MKQADITFTLTDKELSDVKELLNLIDSKFAAMMIKRYMGDVGPKLLKQINEQMNKFKDI